MDSSRNPIPEEIMFEIMTMLPVESLCRFRCVSKLWFFIISDPNFVAAHSERSKSRPKLLITQRRKGDPLKNRRSEEIEMCFYSIDYPEADDDDDDLNVQPRRLHTTAHGLINTCPFGEVISVCLASGLICYTCDRGIRIGNPITGDFDLIQYYPLNETLNVRSILGFDPVDKRQLILKLEDDGYASTAKSSVFSTWESQWHDTPPLPLPQSDIGVYSTYAICINGVIYLYVECDDTTCLYTFDVRLEHFETIQFSPGGRHVNDPILIDYMGRPALVGRPWVDTVHDEITLWILEDPKKHTWSFKSFVVPWRDEDIRLGIELFGATHKAELVFAIPYLREGSLTLFLYAIDTNTLRRFQVDGFAGPTCSLSRILNGGFEITIDYLIESLHSPKRSN